MGTVVSQKLAGDEAWEHHPSSVVLSRFHAVTFILQHLRFS